MPISNNFAHIFMVFCVILPSFRLNLGTKLMCGPMLTCPRKPARKLGHRLVDDRSSVGGPTLALTRAHTRARAHARACAPTFTRTHMRPTGPLCFLLAGQLVDQRCRWPWGPPTSGWSRVTCTRAPLGSTGWSLRSQPVDPLC